MTNWFTVLTGDLISGLIIWGFLEAIFQINPAFGKIMAVMFTAVDYISYLSKGSNLVLPIVEWLEKNSNRNNN